MRFGARRSGLLALVMVTLVGCYESDVPLDQTPQVDIDPALLGTWICFPPRPSSTDETMILTVARSQERTYAITFGDLGKEPDHYEAYATSLKGGMIMNLRDLARRSSGTPWAYTRYVLLYPDVLEVSIVSENLLKDIERSPASLRAAIEHLWEDPKLYEDPFVCTQAAD